MAFNIFKNTAPPARLGVGCNGSMSFLDSYDSGVRVDGQEHDLDGKLIVQRRHVDWVEHQIRWRWLLDCFEGGDRYRNAVYGPDRRGLPSRNLFRHTPGIPGPPAVPGDLPGIRRVPGLRSTAIPRTSGTGHIPGCSARTGAATAQDDDYE